MIQQKVRNMIDFASSKTKAIAALSKVETTSILNVEQREKLGIKEPEVLEVITEVEGLNSKRFDVTMYVVLKSDFPLTFPKIYLNNDSYEQIKFIPHVDPDRFICTFDSEISRPNPAKPEEVLISCVQKAKRIISLGLQGINQVDFEEEFLAYWNCSYYPGDKAPEILCFINPEVKDFNPSILILEKKFGRYEYMLHNNDSSGERVKEFFKENNVEFEEVPVYYCGRLNMEFNPPFRLSNFETLELVKSISDESTKELQKFLNRNYRVKLILGTIVVNGKELLIGWFYKNLNLVKNGFRPGSFTPYFALSNFQKNEKVVRASPEIFTSNRLMNRSKGSIDRLCTLAVIGVGSVGSNLIHFLNNLSFPAFRLIDFDKLKAENAGRHLLGFNYLSINKAVAVKDYLLAKNPTQDVEARDSTIVDIFNNEPDFINNADYIFSVTGKTNVDKWVSEALEAGMIKKPTFFIWVEPYLAGGHCIYVYPKSGSYNTYFSSEDLFKFNVIEDKYYNNPANILALKEAGCQSTFIPYSSSNTIVFLAALFSKISLMIESKSTETTAFTWIGDVEYLKERNINISEFAMNKKMGDLIQH